VKLSGGTPAVKTYKGDNGSPCSNGTFGTCTAARFDVGEYAVQVPGPTAVAVHVLDALAAADAPSEAVAIDDPAVTGARVTRGTSRSYVLGSSAKDGAAGATLAYSVPGDMLARHVVFDAPEDATGTSSVSAHAVGDACAVTITAGGGAGSFAGRPLVFQLAAAKDGCAATEDKPAPPPGTGPGGGADGGVGADGGPNADAPNGSGGGSGSGGCGCRVLAPSSDAGAAIALGVMLGAIGLGRARRRPRR
jgi:hypothetical protein